MKGIFQFDENNSSLVPLFHILRSMSSWDVARLTAHLGDYDIRSQTETQHLTRKIKRLVRHKGFDSRTLVSRVFIMRNTLNWTE